MSGRSAKAGRQRDESEAGASTSKRRDLRTYWPVLAVLVIGGFALFQYTGRKHTGSSGPTAGSGAYSYVVGSPGVGQPAPAVKLPGTAGGDFSLASYRGKQQVLLYFQEGLTCQPCWDQISVIQKDRAKFAALGIGPIVSITTDPLNLISQKASDSGLTIPVLADEGGTVSDTYDARNYGMMGHSRDGHTFVLVGKDGRIRWRADYGGEPKYTMFVPDDELLSQLRRAVGKAQ